MKRHQLVAAVGTLALVANLLIPGMALGQSTSLTASQTVNCGTPGPLTFKIASTYDYANVTAGVAKGTVDTNIAPAATVVPDGDTTRVQDYTSAGGDGCPQQGAGWTLEENITDLIDNASSRTIGLENTSVITSSDLSDTDAGPAGGDPALANKDTTNHVKYSAVAGIGNPWDVVTYVNNKPASYNDDGSNSAYDLPSNTNTFSRVNPNDQNSKAITLADTCSGHNSDIGFGMLFKTNVAATTQPGTYRGFYTTTMLPGICAQIPGGQLTANLGGTANDRTLSVADRNAYIAGEVIRIDGEMMVVTVANVDGVQVKRGAFGTQITTHASGTFTYHIGNMLYSTINASNEPQADILVGATSFTKSSDVVINPGDTLIFSTGQRVTVTGVDVDTVSWSANDQITATVTANSGIAQVTQYQYPRR